MPNSSLPSKVATCRFDYSVGDKDRVDRSLRKAFTRAPLPPPPPSDLPSFIQTLLSCQDEDGKWELTPQVVEALGGHGNIPEPPESLGSSMAGWRWTTALVLALLRREGAPYSHHDELYDSTQIASSLISTNLLSLARASLPPRQCYYPLVSTHPSYLTSKIPSSKPMVE